jgi:type I restriction enzyme S subunit
MDRLLIPLPPLAEQFAIVEKVEALMKYCTELSNEIEQNRLYADDLLKAVLQEAFAQATS